MPKRLSDGEAERRLRSYGYTPRVPYPGSNVKWPSVHEACGGNAEPYLANLKFGKGGCRPCGVIAGAAKRTVDPDAAAEELQGYGYGPIVVCPGANEKWPAVHLQCGKVRNAVLTTLRGGGGCCRPCATVEAAAARVAAGAEAAVAEIRAAGLEPLEDYPGVDESWSVRRLACGHEGPTSLTQVRAGALGCAPCANANRGPWGEAQQAVADMRAAGLEPLVEYPGAKRRWKCRHTCGEIVWPALGNVRAGHMGCNPCAGKAAGLARRVPAAVAYAEAVAAGHRPQVPYPGGVQDPWPSIHFDCGNPCTPNLQRLRVGEVCCVPCGRERAGRARRRDAVEAVAVMEAAGLFPKVPYPGTTRASWPSVHGACGRPVQSSLETVEAGVRCRWCRIDERTAAQTIDAELAASQLRDFGFEPLVDYPGSTVPWKSIHVTCGEVRRPRLTVLKAGMATGCSGCSNRRRVDSSWPARAARATALLALMGYEPVEDYPGALSKWQVRHLACGTVSPVQSAYLSLALEPCYECRATGFGFGEPAVVYLVTDGIAHKVGIAGLGSDRVRRHTKHGWRVFATMRFATGAQARVVEQAVLRHLRSELGLPQYYTAEVMPQGGWSETVNADEIDLPELWAVVASTSRALRNFEGLTGEADEGNTRPASTTRADGGEECDRVSAQVMLTAPVDNIRTCR